MPTLCPAISEPCSTSPSITARRSAPAQKCSISSCASFWSARRDRTASITSRWTSRKRSVALLASARTGITGKRGSSWTDGTASRAAARMKACLKFGCAIDSRGADEAGAELARRPRPSRGRTGSPRRGRCRRRRRPAPRAMCGRISCASTQVETGPIWPPASMPSITSASTPDAHQLLGQHQRRREADDLGAALLEPLRSPARAACRRPARHGRPCRRRRPRSARPAAGAW